MSKAEDSDLIRGSSITNISKINCLGQMNALERNVSKVPNISLPVIRLAINPNDYPDSLSINICHLTFFLTRIYETLPLELFGLCETTAVCLSISQPEIFPAAKLSLQNTHFLLSRF